MRAPGGNASVATLGGMTLARASVETIPANACRRERWKNGLGWTREIARATGADGDGFDWRLSIADIERDAPFSIFPGIDRVLVLLSGNGLRLRFDSGRIDTLAPPHGIARFAGEEAVAGELVDGPTIDFNLMWRRGAVDAQLWHRPMAGAMVVFVDPGETWALHVVAGSARFADGTAAPLLEQGDTALLRAEDQRARGVVEGAGEALLVRISPIGLAPDR